MILPVATSASRYFVAVHFTFPVGSASTDIGVITSTHELLVQPASEPNLVANACVHISIPYNNTL